MNRQSADVGRLTTVCVVLWPAAIDAELPRCHHVADDQDQPAASADATFKSLDRDTDERLSKTEVAKDRMLTEHFAAVDADGDGYLTKGEYSSHMKAMKSERPKKKSY